MSTAGRRSVTLTRRKSAAENGGGEGGVGDGIPSSLHRKSMSASRSVFMERGCDTTIEAISNIHHQPSSEPNPESTNQPKKQEKINPKPGTRRQARNRKIPERLKDYVVD